VGRIYYFELRAWVPLFAYVAYLLLGKRLGREFVAAAGGGYLLTALLLIVGMKSGIRLRDVIGVFLSYESAIEGMIAGFLIVLILWKRPALACLSSVLCLSAVGWLYEVSFWNPIQMFINPIRFASPLAVNTQIISLVLLVVTMWRGGWRPGRLTYVTFTLYLLSSVYLSANYSQFHLFMGEIRRWFIRAPSYALLLSVVWEANKKLRTHR
jgi:hypothetical protein